MLLHLSDIGTFINLISIVSNTDMTVIYYSDYLKIDNKTFLHVKLMNNTTDMVVDAFAKHRAQSKVSV